MLEILTGVFGGLFATSAFAFIAFALFVPGYAFLNGLEKDEKKRKAAQEKQTMQIVIFGSIVVISGVITVVLAILSR